jgi:hypothetical protein
MARGIRNVALATLWLVPLTIFILAFATDWHSVWTALGVDAGSPGFNDLRSISGAVLTYHHGGDPLIANPGDPWHRPMNYPRIWLYLFSTLGINEGNVASVAVVFCILYLLCVSVLIAQSKRNSDALILVFAGLSLAPLMAMERGNNDLIVFSLVFVGCIVPARSLRSSAFCAAAVLKVYPLAAMAIDAIRRPAKEKIASVLLTALVLGLFAWQWRDMVVISRATPVSSSASYGVLSLKTGIEEDWRPWLGNGVAVGSSFIALFGLACVLAVVGAWRSATGCAKALKDSVLGELFSVFGAIYVFSFAIGSNWDYRLIFLLPTLPFAMELTRIPRYKRWAFAYIAAVIMAENASRFPQALAELATSFLFIALSAVLAAHCKEFLFGVSDSLLAKGRLPNTARLQNTTDEINPV